ncbi:hypothetical protein [Cetobacterium sp.]|uniref:hypothetical protein n=1 Tax=Cetobacterium sp. TaxID=2071632 RepID=UPI003F3379A3
MKTILSVIFYGILILIIEKILTSTINNLKNAFSSNEEGTKESSGSCLMNVLGNACCIYIVGFYLSQVWSYYRFSVDFQGAWYILKNIFISTFRYFGF